MKSKDFSISAVRCVAMCFIIICHIAQYYDSFLAWWLNVGVQIFFIISGYLYSNRDLETPIEWLGKQFRKILVPYYIFLLVAGILYYIKGCIIPLSDYVASLFCIKTIDGIGHLWFIKYILFCYIITPYLNVLKKFLAQKSVLRGCIYLFSILLVFVIISTPIYDFLNPIWVCCYIMGYFFGFYSFLISKDKLVLLKWLVLVIAFVMNMSRAYLYYIAKHQDIFNHPLFKYFENVSHLALGFALFFVLSLMFRKIKANKVLSFSDKYSYHVYIVHQLFILSPLSLMAFTSNVILNLALVIFAVAASSILLKKIVDWI